MINLVLKIKDGFQYLFSHKIVKKLLLFLMLEISISFIEMVTDYSNTLAFKFILNILNIKSSF